LAFAISGEPEELTMQRRQFISAMLYGASLVRVRAGQAQSQETSRDVYLERPAANTPHKGKVLLAVQAHSDDIPIYAAGTVAKLIAEGYTGYLLRATNDDMGDAPGLGTPGTIGQNVLGNERDNDEVARVLGLQRVFNFNYGNHRMGDVSQNELHCRLILLIRLLKVDTVICWDPWAHDEGASRCQALSFVFDCPSRRLAFDISRVVLGWPATTMVGRRRISSTSLSNCGCALNRAWNRRVRFGTLSARERSSHSASSPRVASVRRRHSRAATARAM
jgi:GlcNAc-PI de-N-acetylase